MSGSRSRSVSEPRSSFNSEGTTYEEEDYEYEKQEQDRLWL